MAQKGRKAKPMSFSSFPAEAATELVADASVVINLNGTGESQRIIRSLSAPLVVTAIARSELRLGADQGHGDSELLESLIETGLVRAVELDSDADDLFRSLIGAHGNLHDGEAATIAYAIQASGAAILDERKARKLCVERFPKLALQSTADLLISEGVATALGDGHADAIFSALTTARMRVPPELHQPVIGLIGIDRARQCTSLPRSVREPSGDG